MKVSDFCPQFPGVCLSIDISRRSDTLSDILYFLRKGRNELSTIVHSERNGIYEFIKKAIVIHFVIVYVHDTRINVLRAKYMCTYSVIVSEAVSDRLET